MNSRQYHNRKIVGLLQHYIEKYPDLRFHQLLHNLNLLRVEYSEPEEGVKLPFILDNFYEESEVTYSKMNKEL